jgi:hypothetical protein
MSPEGLSALVIAGGSSLHRGRSRFIASANQHFRVVAVMPFEEDDSPLMGLLQVEAA